MEDTVRICMLGQHPAEQLAIVFPPWGVCPECMAKQGFLSDATADIVQRLLRGGFGDGAVPKSEPTEVPPEAHWAVACVVAADPDELVQKVEVLLDGVDHELAAWGRVPRLMGSPQFANGTWAA